MHRRSWPIFDEEQVRAVSRVLESGKVNYWTGDECRSFEAEFADYIGVNHSISLANGTLALDLALRACDVGPGDDVVVTPLSFIASVSSVILCGARPIFADVDQDSQNITVESIESVLTPATKAILPVHVVGWPCDMPGIMELARRRGIKVIEDCAQAHGATVAGAPAGSFGDVSVFSFCQDKIMTTGGEGGMLVTNDREAWEIAWSYKDHGKNIEKMQNKSSEVGFRYVHDSFGTNYRMTEMQAAIGRAQLGKLNDWLAIRRRNARRWDEHLYGISGLRVLRPGSGVGHAYYKYCTQVEPAALRVGWDRDRILGELSSAGVQAYSGLCPEIYREQAFDGYSDYRPSQRLPGARWLGESGLMFLVDPTVTGDEIDASASILKDTMRRAVS